MTQATTSPIIFLYIFLALSGFYSIIVSLYQLTKSKPGQPSDSTLQTKLFKWNAPAGFTYGILSILIVVFIVKFDNEPKLSSDIEQLKNENVALKKEIESLKQFSKLQDITTFEVEMESNNSKSIFGGTVIITYDYGAFSKSLLKFKGIVGVSNSKNGPFTVSNIPIEYGDKIFLLLETGQHWGANVFQYYTGIKIEFYKYELSP